MKSKLKSLSITCFLTALAALSACSETTNNGISHAVYENEVPKEVLNQPRVVVTPQGTVEFASWPRLGDVPGKPNNFSPVPVIEQGMSEMEYDRREAERARQLYENPPPLTAPPIYQP